MAEPLSSTEKHNEQNKNEREGDQQREGQSGNTSRGREGDITWTTERQTEREGDVEREK